LRRAPRVSLSLRAQRSRPGRALVPAALDCFVAVPAPRNDEPFF
jgi:hypothetical protein